MLATEQLLCTPKTATPGLSEPTHTALCANHVRGFCYAGPAAWNSLPHHLHQITDTGLFKRRLKTELFRRANHC